ncbi:hypothetical protein LMG7974_00164 [Campylobacter majalis]|uniref:Excinuclease ABC subunit A n=1 Tax=Campylobacter majalis TaxID=2790656 RepID=A0ABM8Q277_9BACT|nr:excinuclease ABC subunit A [Campylobacter majalis]CAD7286948.1 hypothetical protein LMG7974_00164 [Campylobacter majalis]
MKILSVLIFGCLVCVANAKDEFLKLSIADALNSDLAKEKLSKDIKFYFGSGAKASIVRKGLVSNKKANAVGKDKVVACQRAFISALISFEKTARDESGRKVVNLVSYFKKNTFDSKKEFECAVGNIMVGVALKGDIAK